MVREITVKFEAGRDYLIHIFERLFWIFPGVIVEETWGEKGCAPVELTGLAD